MYFSLKSITVKNLASLENSVTEKDLSLAVNAFENEKKRLELVTIDWATWDDSYVFVNNRNQTFINKNLGYSTLKNLDLSFIIFFNNTGEVVIAQAVDPKNAGVSELPDSLLSAMMARPELLSSEKKSQNISGLMVLAGKPVLFASSPILPSNAHGRINGTLLIGRFIDNTLIEQLSATTRLNLSLPQLSSLPRTDNSYSRSEQTATTVIKPLNQDYIAGYRTIQDFSGRPGILLKIVEPRTFFKQGQSGIYYLGFYIVLLALIFGALTLWMMEKLVLTRICNLSEQLGSIGQSRFSGRVAPQGRDELGKLAASINNTLSQLESSHMQLVESNNRLINITENMLDVLGQIDLHGRFEYCSPSYKKILGKEPDQLIGRSYLIIVHPDDYSIADNSLQQVLHFGTSSYFEFRCQKADGSYIWMETMANAIVAENSSISGAVMVGRDITTRKEAEERIRFISLHDSLTGLYNRNFFEQEMMSLQSLGTSPVALMICDLDGLKFINDTLGHKIGDSVLMRAAGLITDCCDDSIAARIGGDEFAVIIKNATPAKVELAYMNIKDSVANHNVHTPDIPIHISIGFALRKDSSQSMGELFREADNNMYREKLHSQQSMHSGVVCSLMQALQERDYITSGHAERMEKLVQLLGESLGLSLKSMHDLNLLARFHDIGKVGVPDSILFKTDSLTDDEYRQMQRHSEIGYRIARASSELQPIADWILKHHEWWNGQGYPLGIKADDIPLECRILAIADAFDAMTSMRSYREASTVNEALDELRSYSGRQFDPNLISIFIDLIENNSFFDLKYYEP